jgi:transposase-like protein
VRDEGIVNKKAVYVVLAITMDGMKEVLGLYVGENESSKYWLGVLNDLKNRNLKTILILCSDGLSGLKEAVQAAYPKVEHQRCIIHQIRNTLKYTSHKDKREFAKDLKRIYTAENEEKGYEELMEVTDKWKGKYANAMTSWENNWDVISPFFKYSKETRKIMYTTNTIESLNSGYRRLNKNRSIFPTPQSLMKCMYLSTKKITKKWVSKYSDWGVILGQLEIMFEGQIQQY